MNTFLKWQKHFLKEHYNKIILFAENKVFYHMLEMEIFIMSISITKILTPYS